MSAPRGASTRADDEFKRRGDTSPESSENSSDRSTRSIDSPRLQSFAVPTPWSEMLVSLLQPALLQQLQECDPAGARVVQRRDASAFARYMHELQSFGSPAGQEIRATEEPPHAWGTDDYDDASEYEGEGPEEAEEDDLDDLWSGEEEDTALDDDANYDLVEYDEVPWWLDGVRLDISPLEMQLQLRERFAMEDALRQTLEAEEPETAHAIFHASRTAFADFLERVDAGRGAAS